MSEEKIAILESKIEVLEREKGELINVLNEIIIMDEENDNEVTRISNEVLRLLKYHKKIGE